MVFIEIYQDLRSPDFWVNLRKSIMRKHFKSHFMGIIWVINGIINPLVFSFWNLVKLNGFIIKNIVSIVIVNVEHCLSIFQLNCKLFKFRFIYLFFSFPLGLFIFYFLFILILYFRWIIIAQIFFILLNFFFLLIALVFKFLITLKLLFQFFAALYFTWFERTINLTFIIYF